MILCDIYAHAAALLWSGLCFDMTAEGNVIRSAYGCAEISRGCLALHAVRLVGWVGVALAVAFRRPALFPSALAVALLFSFLRNFVLVGLMFRCPDLFSALHAQCGYAVFLASLAVLAWLIPLKGAKQ